MTPDTLRRKLMNKGIKANFSRSATDLEIMSYNFRQFLEEDELPNRLPESA
jgi:hypothetical protein